MQKTKIANSAAFFVALLLPALMCLAMLPGVAAADDTFDCMSPVGMSTIEPIELAPRLDTLEGKTIAIVGRSFNATTTQAVLKELILADYPTATVYTVDDLGCGGVFSVFHQSAQSREFQRKLVEFGVDAVICGNCGCGLCTVKESGSAIAAEYIGIPSVTVGATTYIPEIHSTAVNRGVPVLRTAEYPGAFSADTRDELKRKSAEIIYPLVVEALTTPITDEERAQFAREGERVYDDVLVSGGYDMLQSYYKECGYTDGLPIGLPTPEKVADYLRYTPYDGSEVIGSLPLAYRECRVYTVAVNAIMAGCPPEYMPLCVAFAQGMSDGTWRRTLASTHGWSPYAWLNGPLARQLGISFEQGMISEAANKTFGRFIELAMMNLGGYYIGENRMGTFGYLEPWAFAEDEAACLRLGWDPYHVTQGFGLDESTITMASALAWGNNVTPATPDPEQVMTLMAWDITEKEQNGLGNTNPQVYRTIFVTEAVAANLAEEYSSKDALEDALIQTARRPLWMRTYANYWANTGSYQYVRRSIEEHYQMLLDDPAEGAALTDVPAWLAPLFEQGQKIMTVATMLKGQTPILVCGDLDRNKFQVMPGGGYVTIRVELPENWDELMAERGYEPLDSFVLDAAAIRSQVVEQAREQGIAAGMVAAPAGLTDGAYRMVPREDFLTGPGRMYYAAEAGVLQYWAGGAEGVAQAAIDPAGAFASALAHLAPNSGIMVKNGLVDGYVVRPFASMWSNVVDATGIAAEALEGASLTLAITAEANAATGGASPDGGVILLDGSLTRVGIDLGGWLVCEAGGTEGFVIGDGGDIMLDPAAPEGSWAKVGTPIEDAPGAYRTLAIAREGGLYRVTYAALDWMDEPVALI